MKVQLRPWSTPDGESGVMLYLWCPGCEDLHGVEVDTSRTTSWAWNHSFESATISPSISCMGPKGICHSFVRDGRWEFLTDSYHALAGQMVDLPELPDWLTAP